MKVFTVVGNRPQFIKAAPLSAALREAGIDEVVLHTGQHWYHTLSQVFFDQLGIAEPQYRLDLHTSDVEVMRPEIAARIAEEEPDIVLVYGDTNSTLAGARAAADASIPLAHVEAGLRSGDLEMPEEHNRIETDRLSWLLFCPDDRSRHFGRCWRCGARVEYSQLRFLADMEEPCADHGVSSHRRGASINGALEHVLAATGFGEDLDGVGVGERARGARSAAGNSRSLCVSARRSPAWSSTRWTSTVTRTL